MANKEQNLIYALKDGKAVHISEVESGLKCGCVCPACGEKLVAKKGDRVAHHFAHYSGHTCEYGFESSLHLAAKDIISKAKKFVIPAVYLNFPKSEKEKQLLFPSREIFVDDVKLEQRYGNIVPDIVLISKGKELFIEIFVTHRIDEVKLEKLKQANISTIEIDLSKQQTSLTSEELSNILLEDNKVKTWKYNAVAKNYLEKFYEIADKRKIISRGMYLHVDYCPLGLREWKGKSYAGVITDCLDCEFCLYIKNEESILCSGRLRISKVEDFNISIEQRIKDNDRQREEAKIKTIAKGICPKCGSRLVTRESEYGTFWGCSYYPKCKFMVIRDPETGQYRTKN